MAAAALAVLVVGLGALWLVGSLTPSDEVAVPVVDGATSPEPGFDMTQFGREIPLRPSAGQLQPEIRSGTLDGDAVAVGQIEGTDLEVFKWDTVDGETCVQVVGPRFRDTQCSTEPAGGLDPSDPLDGPEPFVTIRDDGAGDNEVIGVWRVPENTSVVGGLSIVGGSTDTEDRFWQRPVSGVSAFVFGSDTSRVTLEAADVERLPLAVGFFSPSQVTDPVATGETELQGSPEDLVELDASHPVNQILTEGADDIESFAQAADERGLHFVCGGGEGGSPSHSLCLVGTDGTLIVVPFGDEPGLTARVSDGNLVEDVVVPLDRTEPIGVANLGPTGPDVQVEYFGEVIGATSRPTLTVAPAAGDDCLVGTWVLDNESFLEGYTAVLAESGMDDAEVDDLGGTYTIDMHPDGSFTADREDWGYSVTAQGETFVLTANGGETGTWFADGSTITITTDVSNVTVDMSRVVDGEQIPLPGSQSAFDAPSIATTSDYGCSADITTVIAENGSYVMHRG